MKAYIIKDIANDEYYCGGKDYYAKSMLRSTIYSTEKAAQRVVDKPGSKTAYFGYGDVTPPKPIVKEIESTEV